MLQHVYNQYHIHAISQNSSDNLVYDQHKNSCFQYRSIRHIELQMHFLSQNLVVLLRKKKGEKMAVKTVQATINGQTYTLTLNSTSGKYEATVTAPSKSSYNQSGHYYGVTVKATDVAGNITTKDAADATLGKSLRLQVKEKVAPIIAITAPTVGTYLTNNKPTITWKVTDADSGVNPATIGITIDSETKITGDSIAKTAITGGYQCTYTPTTALSDGSHTIKLDASDYDGNAAATSSTSFKVDTVPPVLTLSSPTDKLVTNQSACTVKGTTNDATSSPVTVTVKLNSGAAEAEPAEPERF